MSNSNIKALLKEAREAIKNKDYQLASKLSKIILKNDKTNYTALVFLGVSFQEAGPAEQAPLAFQKAIQLNPDQVLAWNGLANYYEKYSPDQVQELVNVYIKIIELESDELKLEGTIIKLVPTVLKVEDKIFTAIKALEKLIENEKTPKTIQYITWKSIVTLLLQKSNLSEDHLVLLETALNNILNDTDIEIQYKKEYLKLLYKRKKYTLLYLEANKFLNTDEKDVTYILEWICKIYVENVIEDNLHLFEFSKDINEQIESFVEKLQEIQPGSIMILFTKSVKLYLKQKYLESKIFLDQITSTRGGLIHAWVLLAQCCLKLLRPNDAIRPIQKADKLLQSTEYSNPSLRKLIDITLVTALSKHTDSEENWKKALDVCDEFLEKYNGNCDILLAKINALINCGNYNEARNILSNVKAANECNKGIIFYLEADIFHKEKKFEKALEILESNDFDFSEWYGKTGIIHWELDQMDKCLIPLLKAAKLHPECHIWFLYLGRYYAKVGDEDKARRCYEKSFKINPRCSFAGIELSNIYREQKNWKSNLELLHSVTGNMISNENKWAWLQLGLNYLDQGDSLLAIDTLRSVTRIDSENSHCWECLADAYLARGAYTSALKAYQRAIELGGNELYPNLQIASIKQMLGKYVEAREDFETTLILSDRYVPALKGLAETCLYQARQYFNMQMLGLSRGTLQYAVDKITIALKERSDLSCLWKLLGDCCVSVTLLPKRYCKLNVLSALYKGTDAKSEELLEEISIFVLAERSYCKAISLTEDNVLIWQDLAGCYLAHAQKCNETDERISLCERSLSAVKYCISKCPGQWESWNLLGTIASDKCMKQYSLAQHAFIKAVTINNNSAVSWCNLGALYSTLGDVKLANDSYAQAQRADPNYVSSWIGQAIIAEQAGHEDAMDLFRHSTQLRQHQQGGIGYGHWVCRILMDSPANAIIYSIHNMHAVPVACDVITWYTQHNTEDPCAWNMLGLLQERMGLNKSALESFKEAIRLTPANFKDKVITNCARLLIQTEQYNEAIIMLQDIKEATFNSGVELALACFKAKRYKESYEAYKSALHWLTEDQGLQSHLLVALATMAFMFQGPDAAKTLLFQSIQLKPPSCWGLFATLSLGLLTKDLKLSKLVLQELSQLRDDPSCLGHYGILLAYTLLLQGDSKNAIRELSKQLHRHPGDASLWLHLSTLLLRIPKGDFPIIASRCAQVAMKLGRVNMDVTKVQCMVSLGSLIVKDYKQALKSAQKAVHCYPNVSESWALLSASLLLDADPINNFDKLPWILKTIDFVDSKFDCYKPLKEWFALHREIVQETLDAR